MQHARKQPQRRRTMIASLEARDGEALAEVFTLHMEHTRERVKDVL